MGVTGGYISTSIWATYGGNRKPYIHVNLGHGHGHAWGQQEATYPRQFEPWAWPCIGVIGSQIWTTGMAMHGGNRRLDLGHGHDYKEVIEGYISI